MGMLSFTVHGTPAPAGSKRAFRNPKTGGMIVTDANKLTKPWQAAVAAAGAHAKHEADLDLLTGPLKIWMCFFRPRPKSHYGTGRNSEILKSSAPAYPTGKPDVLKLARACEDALTGIIWRDDSQIVTEQLTKDWGEPARVEVAVFWGESVFPSEPRLRNLETYAGMEIAPNERIPPGVVGLANPHLSDVAYESVRKAMNARTRRHEDT